MPLEQDIPLQTIDEVEAEDQAAARGPSVQKRVLAAALVLIIIVGWEIGATLYYHGATPTAQDWKAAAGALKKQRKPDREPLLFAPHWVEPLGRLHFGDQLDLEEMLLSDVDRYGRVWLVSVRGTRHPWLQGKKPARVWTFGGVTLGLFENDRPAVVSFDFTRRVMEAQVDRIGHSVTRCARAAKRFVCDPSRSWNWVGPHLAEVGHRPYRCIYAHPVDAHVMRLSFPAVEMGKSIVGYTGIDDFENRKRGKDPVILKVFIGPRLISTIRHQNHWPWRRFVADTAEVAGQTHPVRFEVSTERAYARTFCFAAEARK